MLVDERDILMQTVHQAEWDAMTDEEKRRSIAAFRLNRWHDAALARAAVAVAERTATVQALDETTLAKIHTLAHDQNDPRIFKGTPSEFFAKAAQSVEPEPSPSASLQDFRIAYYTMSDGQAEIVVQATDRAAAVKIVQAREDCAQVMGG